MNRTYDVTVMVDEVIKNNRGTEVKLFRRPGDSRPRTEHAVTLEASAFSPPPLLPPLIDAAISFYFGIGTPVPSALLEPGAAVTVVLVLPE